MEVYFDRISNLMHDLEIDWQVFAMICAAAVILFFVICLLLRGFRLWYWKVNVQVDTLQKIDEQLKTIHETIKESPAKTIGQEMSSEEITLKAVEQQSEAESSEDDDNKQKAEMKVTKFFSIDQNISKSGKCFTVEEIEAQIRD